MGRRFRACLEVGQETATATSLQIPPKSCGDEEMTGKHRSLIQRPLRKLYWIDCLVPMIQGSTAENRILILV